MLDGLLTHMLNRVIRVYTDSSNLLQTLQLHCALITKSTMVPIKLRIYKLGSDNKVEECTQIVLAEELPLSQIDLNAQGPTCSASKRDHAWGTATLLPAKPPSSQNHGGVVQEVDTAILSIVAEACSLVQ